MVGTEFKVWPTFLLARRSGARDMKEIGDILALQLLEQPPSYPILSIIRSRSSCLNSYLWTCYFWLVLLNWDQI